MNYSTVSVTLRIDHPSMGVSTRKLSDGSVAICCTLVHNVGDGHSIQQRVEINVEPGQLIRVADELQIAADMMRRVANAHVAGCRCDACKEVIRG